MRESIVWVAGGAGIQVDGIASAKTRRQVHAHLFTDGERPVRLGQVGRQGVREQAPDLGGPCRPVEGLWPLV